VKKSNTSSIEGFTSFLSDVMPFGWRVRVIGLVYGAPGIDRELWQEMGWPLGTLTDKCVEVSLQDVTFIIPETQLVTLKVQKRDAIHEFYTLQQQLLASSKGHVAPYMPIDLTVFNHPYQSIEENEPVTRQPSCQQKAPLLDPSSEGLGVFNTTEKILEEELSEERDDIHSDSPQLVKRKWDHITEDDFSFFDGKVRTQQHSGFLI
jgi:hypothetical protein